MSVFSVHQQGTEYQCYYTAFDFYSKHQLAKLRDPELQ